MSRISYRDSRPKHHFETRQKYHVEHFKSRTSCQERMSSKTYHGTFSQNMKAKKIVNIVKNATSRLSSQVCHDKNIMSSISRQQ